MFWVLGLGRSFRKGGIALNTNVFQCFERAAFQATKVRNVSRLGATQNDLLHRSRWGRGFQRHSNSTSDPLHTTRDVTEHAITKRLGGLMVSLVTGCSRGNPVRLDEFFERIEYLESGTPEVLIVACRDGQPMPPGGRRDVAVFDRHTLAGLVEQPFLISPYVCD